MEKVNIAEKLKQVRGYWKPHIVGELNEQYVKLTKLKGRFIWHYHKDEDEMFLVVKGRFLMELRDGKLWIEEGEFIIIPRGVEHRPSATEEVQILLFEPKSTLNTGNVRNKQTLRSLKRI
jgi:mannose-6-phosphate isomerase-like protein (cupin superfamily)